MTGSQPEVQSQCLFAASICHSRFIGIQQMYGVREDQALFTSPRGTTLAIPVSQVSPLTLAFRIAESNLLFRDAA